jgi:hypothetical protein
MIYKTYSPDTAKFLSLPETGMGYQLVEANIYGLIGRKKYLVYNGELVVDWDTNFDFYRRRIIAEGFSNLVRTSQYLNFDTATISLASKELLIERRVFSESERRTKNRYSGGSGAKDNPEIKTNGKETFVRLSAYENDKRIDFIKKRLLDGSYATTEGDYLDCVKFDDEPIDRYALPNDEKVKWAFYILPSNIDTVQVGIAQPAFGHYGGGIEAFFKNGTNEGTYQNRREYGK